MPASLGQGPTQVRIQRRSGSKRERRRPPGPAGTRHGFSLHNAKNREFRARLVRDRSNSQAHACLSNGRSAQWDRADPGPCHPGPLPEGQRDPEIFDSAGGRGGQDRRGGRADHDRGGRGSHPCSGGLGVARVRRLRAQRDLLLPERRLRRCQPGLHQQRHHLHQRQLHRYERIAQQHHFLLHQPALGPWLYRMPLRKPGRLHQGNSVAHDGR
ncbi:hypothetical protein F8566_07195 [Actinomadura rudentiformis]|uniref:Uncharacterized protein n=1 Tax=Actinomadura rudentiformis TaxID=359158 RepID=A0A6H9Z6G4_9ACTN|nr:hypothetical protein F8566_07195 [Actinomadura rudentiformis]